MTWPAGGIADKLGGRYERHWVAHQLLRVLNGELISVKVDSVRNDGIDLTLTKPNGAIEVQQCKGHNTNNKPWTVSDLKNNSVIGHAATILRQRPDATYRFISGTPTACLESLCDRARMCDGDSKEFVDAGLSSAELRKEYDSLCVALDIRGDKAEGVAEAFTILERMYFDPFADNDSTIRNLGYFAQHLVQGNSQTVIKLLSTYPIDDWPLARDIRQDKLRAFLVCHGMQIRPQEPIDDQLRLEILKELFDDSITHGLIAGGQIEREETDACIDALRSHNVVFLTGEAGAGKTAVLSQVVDRMIAAGAVCLPIRVDRKIPEGSIQEYGKKIGLSTSPVDALCIVAGARPALLVIDQLDAVRWTAQHSHEALEVCKQLCWQAIQRRADGYDVRLLLASRTFDLDQDLGLRELKHLDEPHNTRSVVVGNLRPEQAEAVIGPAWHSMHHTTQSALTNALNLKLYSELVTSGQQPPRVTTALLIERFISARKREITSQDTCTAGEIESLLDSLVDFLDAHGQISWPVQLLDSLPSALDALVAHGVLVREADRVLFAHQSYLDYRIARRFVDAVLGGQSLADLLGPHERQTLVRRNQARLGLQLLWECDHALFVDTARQMLVHPLVRTHLRHVCLEALSELDTPDTGTEDFCLELVADGRWRQHVVSMVLARNGALAVAAVRRGPIRDWLYSGDDSSVREALLVLRCASSIVDDEVAAMVEPYTQQSDEAGRQVLYSVLGSGGDESEGPFRLRVQLAKRGIRLSQEAWPELVSLHPDRAIEMLSCLLARFERPSWHDWLPRTPDARESYFSAADIAALELLAREQPRGIWSLLMDHLERISPSDEDDLLRYALNRSEIHEDMVGLASRLAAEACSSLLRGPIGLGLPPEVARHLDDSSIAVQRVLCRSLRDLRPGSADLGLVWLMRDDRRFRLGDGATEVPWAPAAKLIQALASACSDRVHAQLERHIANYKEPDFLSHAKWVLEKRRRFGQYLPYWGAPQKYLLAALDQARIAARTCRLIHNLECQYENVPDEAFLQMGGSAGFVKSDLADRYANLSDGAWLRLVSPSPPQRGVSPRHFRAGAFVENTPEQFASALGEAAQREPERFCRLALRFGENTNPIYVAPILRSAELLSPQHRVEDDVIWEAASLSTVYGLLGGLCRLDDRETALAFCHAVAARGDADCPLAVLENVCKLATSHPDPEPGRLAITSGSDTEEPSVEMLWQNTLNCVRSAAAVALGYVLFRAPNLADEILPTIQSLVTDRHIVVRMASVHSLSALYRQQPERAVELFLKATRGDERVAAIPYASRFLGRSYRALGGQLQELLPSLLESRWESVREAGASLATAMYLHSGACEADVKRCAGGAPHERRGVARVAVQFAVASEPDGEAWRLIQDFLDDSDETVTAAWSQLISNQEFDLARHSRLLDPYVRSAAFRHYPHALMHRLGKHTGPLIPLAHVILSLCDVAVFSTDPNMSRLALVSRDLPDLLLRLYDESESKDATIRNDSLNAWDVLFEKGIGRTRELTRNL